MLDAHTPLRFVPQKICVLSLDRVFDDLDNSCSVNIFCLRIIQKDGVYSVSVNSPNKFRVWEKSRWYV